jgi:PAS domain S-box-containing protein
MGVELDCQTLFGRSSGNHEYSVVLVAYIKRKGYVMSLQKKRRSRPPASPRRGAKELQVPQIELQVQNDALRERERLLQAILNTAPDAIITYNRRGTIVAANAATERIFGYREDELVGQSVKRLMPPPHGDVHDGYIARYLPTGGSHSRETVGLRKDGSTFPTELAVSEIAHLGLFTGIHRDVSARKRTEQELDQYRKDLKSMAAELMLAEERERRRLAEEMHDGFGQALFRVRMKLDQLATVEPRVDEVVTILEEMRRMTSSVTFELSPPVLRTVGLGAAVRSLAKDMSRRYGLSVQVAEDNGRDIPLDERAALILFRSVRELLINVVKHAQTNQVTLSLRRRSDCLQIEIKDRGKGFDPADQSRHTRSGQFGLFSIRERLEYIGGTIKIWSIPNAGTTVILTAPLATGKAAGREAR